MRPLNKKLGRDIWRLRGQILAIGMVIASGIAVLVMSLGTLEALRETADAYYDRSDFAHVFANLKRAPNRLGRRVGRIPGVQTVETRIVQLALLDIEDFEEPVVAQMVSIPERETSRLNRLTLRAGRTITPGVRGEVLVNESFAEAHDLRPGDHLQAIVNGKEQRLEVVGTALSPEYVYALGPGALVPDDKRYGIIWMGRKALAAAYDFEGSFNELSLTLQRGVEGQAVIEQVDRLLDRFGGMGAYPRADQISNFFLMNEIEQLANLAGILPVIFLAVAAFLTHIVLTRLIDVERGEIGLLKAFGYSDARIGWHFIKLVLVIGVVGITFGFGFGAFFGRAVTRMYADFFHFPFFIFQPSPALFILSGFVSLGAAVLGSSLGVRRATRLPPAEAMRPPAPLLYRHMAVADRIEGLFDQPTRMIFRQISRHPVRSLVTTFGVAMSVGLLVMSMQWEDAVNYLIENYYQQAQHQDATLALLEAESGDALFEIARLPAVLSAEPIRYARARLRSGRRSKLEPIQGISSSARLAPITDAKGNVLPVPQEGLVIGTKLAEILDLSAGDAVTVEILEGRRPHAEVPITAIFETHIGTPAIMDIEALNRLLREPPSITGANLLVDSRYESALFSRLKEIPEISAAVFRGAAIRSFQETLAETMLMYIAFFSAFSSMLTFGVTYNATRIALSERARELATLRVLGLGRGEVSYILLGEIGFLAALGLPVGCAFGVLLTTTIASSFETELFRVPMVIEGATFGGSILIACFSAVVSAALVRRRLDRLDLISVLKTRE